MIDSLNIRCKVVIIDITNNIMLNEEEGHLEGKK